ncbi:hypothetical protein C8F01DRAFT_777392 [Mycena amicta]|nr:hypothetical protein C8F01DRAFT_777392 [Mycena amicta]
MRALKIQSKISDYCIITPRSPITCRFGCIDTIHFGGAPSSLAAADCYGDGRETCKHRPLPRRLQPQVIPVLSSPDRSVVGPMVFKLKAKTATMLSALLAPLWASKCGAILINITVDDTNTTAWTWVGSWHVITQNNPCPECGAQLDGNRVYNHSWHDGVLHSGSFTFQGVAVYIYGIDIEDPANITFGMSNPPISTFYYKNTGGGYIYNSIFFSADGLYGTSQHTVT